MRFLEQRIVQRQLWSARSVREFLQGAVNVAVAGEPARAREALAKATDIFESDVQTKNRLFYLVGAFLGSVMLAALATGVLFLSKHTGWEGAKNLADEATVASLFMFAGMGSVASVLSRLETINLRKETRRQWVVVSAATRPLVAIAFASVAHVIITNKMVQFGSFETAAVDWVAAFLCGFSERFGVDLLGSLSFVGSKRSDSQAGDGNGEGTPSRDAEPDQAARREQKG